MYADTDLVGIFVAAFLGSFGHCVGMCGGIVIGFNSIKNANKPAAHAVIGNLLYLLGKMVSYVSMGMLAGLVGSGIMVGKTSSGIVWILVGTFVITSSVLLNFFPKAFGYITANIANVEFNWYKDSLKSMFASKTLGSFFALGVLNGLLPCGFVYSFIAISVGTGSITKSVLVMFTFALATFLPLFLVGVGSARIMRSKYKTKFLRLSLVLMVFLGSIDIFRGYQTLFETTQGEKQHHCE